MLASVGTRPVTGSGDRFKLGCGAGSCTNDFVRICERFPSLATWQTVAVSNIFPGFPMEHHISVFSGKGAFVCFLGGGACNEDHLKS